jgi:hypothetical protein
MDKPDIASIDARGLNDRTAAAQIALPQPQQNPVSALVARPIAPTQLPEGITSPNRLAGNLPPKSLAAHLAEGRDDDESDYDSMSVRPGALSARAQQA